MNVEYNKNKLCDTGMEDKKVLVAGVGAVGSIVAELLTRGQTELISVIDKDFYESGNIPKSSAIIRFPEDIGKSKSLALCERLNAVAASGCRIVGNHLDLKRIGPMALTQFDYIVLALDNNAIKVHLANLIASIPREKRPVVLSGGTNREFSEAMIFVPDGACLRCTIPDDLLRSEDPEMIFSCAARVNLLLPEKQREIVSTSGAASMKCAIDINDMVLAHANGLHHFSKSERVTHHAYPTKESHRTMIMKHSACPLCSTIPPEDVEVLPGVTTKTTLKQLLDMISETGCFGESEFILKVHRLVIPSVKITQCYMEYVLKAKCNTCGELFPIMRHSGLIRKDEIVCPHCGSIDTTVERKNDEDEDLVVGSFDYNSDKALLESTLFDLGFPLGAYYETEEVVKLAETFEEVLLNLPTDILPDEEYEEDGSLRSTFRLPERILKSRFFSLKGDETYLYKTHLSITGNHL